MNKTPNEQIGQNIKMFRKKKKLTQKELGIQSGVAEISIRQYEGGKRRPRVDILERIARVLDVSMDTLLSPGSILVWHWEKNDKIIGYKVAAPTNHELLQAATDFVLGLNDAQQWEVIEMINAYIKKNQKITDDVKRYFEMYPEKAPEWYREDDD